MQTHVAAALVFAADSKTSVAVCMQGELVRNCMRKSPAPLIDIGVNLVDHSFDKASMRQRFSCQLHCICCLLAQQHVPAVWPYSCSVLDATALSVHIRHLDSQSFYQVSVSTCSQHDGPLPDYHLAL